MWQLAIPRPLRLLALVVLAVVVAACSRDSRSDAARGPVVTPASYDVTLIAEKDGQFDYQDVPLTAQDLRAALNYRKEQGLPMKTLLLKRGEKNRIKDSHIVALARIAVALEFTAYLEEKGEINEIRATTKAEPEPAK
ncbi:MAG: hypothetical protein IPH43_02900 [Xanthomonadales bacterium]|uniref:hypothetical protein n=1 Tax=Dokdonella sp. TaxID=2291710 RepID=UPI002BB4950E|nr:hypothetical protein [Xanthomonadales bacterium]HQV72928.1 hypothetical protein [Dokdonella sp.]MBK7011732.1 hypothetical protein [Xanthomonadales bacterium]MBL0223546.1 hypothetical protein [Xanthomonadales bacterium]HQW77221.1 hypothetical protein [Dokdonella sp.]